MKKYDKFSGFAFFSAFFSRSEACFLLISQRNLRKPDYIHRNLHDLQPGFHIFQRIQAKAGHAACDSPRKAANSPFHEILRGVKVQQSQIKRSCKEIIGKIKHFLNILFNFPNIFCNFPNIYVILLIFLNISQYLCIF